MVSFEIGTLTIYSGHNLNSVKTTWCSINDSKFTFQPLEWTFYIWNTVSSMNGMAMKPMKPMKHWRVTIFFGKIHLRLQSATRRWLTFLHKYIFGKSRSMTQLKINKVSYLQTAWTNIQIFPIWAWSARSSTNTYRLPLYLTFVSSLFNRFVLFY